MRDWKKTLVNPKTSIRKTIEIIDGGSMQIALVVGDSNKLLGTVTDGDIRRGLLRGVSLQSQVCEVMSTNPTVAGIDESKENILSLMKSKELLRIPLVDSDGRVVGLESWDNLINIKQRDNCIVIIAGGLGTRLGHLTKDCPKPLLRVGTKPILESILENCIAQGFRQFYFSINYMSHMFKEYFGDGSRWSININYIQEEKKLGTAGPLGLLPKSICAPLIVMNADILTKINLNHLIDYHTEHKAKATACIREYDFQIPYGVVKIDNYLLSKIEEKPIQRFFVSAGIYVIEPETLIHVAPDEYLDMPTLLNKLVDNGSRVATFPIHEYWLDIGRMDDLERANIEYPEVFL